MSRFKLGQALKLCQSFDVRYFESCVDVMRGGARRDGEMAIVCVAEALLAEMKEDDEQRRPRAVPLPAVLPCGCSEQKVRKGMCRVYNPNGRRRG